MGLNYLAELNAMRDYLLLRPLASGQISLWHGLMMINKPLWLEELVYSAEYDAAGFFGAFGQWNP